MEAVEPGSSATSPGPRPTPRGLPALTLVAQAYTVVILGLLGFGLILFWGPGLLLLPFVSPTGSEVGTAAEVTAAGFLLVGGVVLAVLGVGRRVARGDLEGARLPALWLALGNVGIAAVAGVLVFDQLAAVGAIGALLFFGVFWLINGQRAE